MAENASWKAPLVEGMEFTEAQVIWAVRNEMARTVEDVLARRTRILFIDAKAAYNVASKVAEIMMKELEKDVAWKNNQILTFQELAKGYWLDND